MLVQITFRWTSYCNNSNAGTAKWVFICVLLFQCVHCCFLKISLNVTGMFSEFLWLLLRHCLMWMLYIVLLMSQCCPVASFLFMGPSARLGVATQLLLACWCSNPSLNFFLNGHSNHRILRRRDRAFHSEKNYQRNQFYVLLFVKYKF